MDTMVVEIPNEHFVRNAQHVQANSQKRHVESKQMTIENMPIRRIEDVYLDNPYAVLFRRDFGYVTK